MITGSVFINAAAEQIRCVGFFWLDFFGGLLFLFFLFFSFDSVGIRKFLRTDIKSQWNVSMKERAMKGSRWHCTCCLRGKVDTSSQILHIYLSIYLYAYEQKISKCFTCLMNHTTYN